MPKDIAGVFSDADDIPLEDLREENEKYKLQMENLNKEIDNMLRNRNRPQRKKVVNMSPELAALMRTNERLRKERLRLYGEATHSDTAQRIAEMRNKLGHLSLQIDEKQSDIRGLQNIKRNQEFVVEVAKHNEDEMRFLQDEHRQEMNDFREKYHALTLEYKVEERRLATTQARYHTALEKLKLDLDAAQLRELEELVEAQQAEIDEMQSRAGELHQQADGHRNKEFRKSVAVEREIAAFKQRIDELEEMAKEREKELKRSYANSKA